MRIPDIRRRPWQNIDFMIIGALGMFDGLAKVLSLGFAQTNVEMSYLCWRTQQTMKRQ
jgi:hypothetical protein